jgi:D-alanyl-lipoteichoic acid acyltransferase DltB (MBOAT superfamily)
MWFNSYSFILFCTVVFAAHVVRNHRFRNLSLLICSYFFYGCWDWRFLGLIFFTTTFEFLSAKAISQSASAATRKAWVTASLVVELSILGTFKYLGFFVAELGHLLARLGLPGAESWTLHILLPAGISFFTFQALSYTLDVYRRETKATHDFLDFALFISFFPQLVAGPIERSSHLLPQVQQPRPRLDETRFSIGLYHVLTGFFKKIVIADNMAWLANHVFANGLSGDGNGALPLNGLEVLLGVYAFAFQIYGDFSGYSSIAIGIATWLGFDLMENFRRPYFATSPTLFWSRWHISLSTWLRDYLYIPLGGNRHGLWKTARNLMLTMLLGGLWHGANWTFIVWGALHGGWLVLHRWVTAGVQKQKKPVRPVWTHMICLVGTFHFVCLCWLLFRAADLNHAMHLLSTLIQGGWSLTPYTQTTLTLLVFFLLPWVAYETWVERSGSDLVLLKSAWPLRAAFYAYLMAMIVFFPPPIPAEFIYFQF